MIFCAAGGLELHFLGVLIFFFLGKSCIYVFSELCRCCVKEVVYTCRAIFGCRVGALRSLEGVQRIGRFAVPPKKTKNPCMCKKLYIFAF